jgi:hypothetical protein
MSGGKNNIRGISNPATWADTFRPIFCVHIFKIGIIKIGSEGKRKGNF